MSRRVGIREGSLLVASIALREVVRMKVLLGIGALAGFAIAIALLIYRYEGANAPVNFEGLQLFLVTPVVAPLVALIFGIAALGSEREGGTLPYLFTRPMPRAAVVFGKGIVAMLAACAAVSAIVILVFLASGAPIDTSLVGALLAVILTTAALTAIFVLLGALFARALFVGLAYAALYEGFLGGLLAPLNPTSISYHARNLLLTWSGTHLRRQGMVPPVTTATESVVVLLGVVVVCFGAAAAWVSLREYGLKDRPKED